MAGPPQLCLSDQPPTPLTAPLGSTTSSIAEVEARCADGHTVKGAVFTIPGTSVRIWELGLPGRERLGSPLPGVNLVVRDAHGQFLGQGTLWASLPNPFPVALATISLGSDWHP